VTTGAKRFTVAVADDDRGVLGSLGYLLESEGYAVRLFESAQALLDSGCVEHIDCLISDVDMPGLDGFALLRVIHATRAGLPAVLITGYPERVVRARVDGGTSARVFTKPFKAEELLAALSEALAGSPP
jgi:FixJ family two-component response regulator